MSQKKHKSIHDLQDDLDPSETAASEPQVESQDDAHHEAQHEDNLLTQLKEEVSQYKNEVLRARAETENVRRRMERDVANAHKYGAERLVGELLPVMDSLSRGIEQASGTDDTVQNIRSGMEMTLDILRKILEKNGVSEIIPQKGDVFDPAQHEAMSLQKDPSAAPNTVLQVFQPGYALNGRVIRAAMVMVSSGG